MYEETRAIAAETLGKIGASGKVSTVLSELAKRRWKNTERVREAARRALEMLKQRKVKPADKEGGKT